jgi:alanine dehydrogenase
MIIGVPRERKNHEYRAGMTPAAVRSYVREGHAVRVETGCGAAIGYADEDYRAAGAVIVPSAEDVWAADMVVKVKEPVPEEYRYFREGLILFAYLHLAADPALTKEMVERKVVGVAYETIQTTDGGLPLLTPMSEVAGRLSIQIGARFLERHSGGRGVLLGGVPGVPPGKVTIIGGGTVGTNAARMAVGLGAEVCVLDINPQRLRELDELFRGRVRTLMAHSHNIAEAVGEADLVVGAVLIPGARAPRLVSADMVRAMNPGSVIVDVAVDQGGSIETVDRITTHDEPVYEKFGVIHYAVANMPSAVARTSTIALSNVTTAFGLQLAAKPYKQAALENPALAKGINVAEGKVIYPAVAAAHGYECAGLESLLGRAAIAQTPA